MITTQPSLQFQTEVQNIYHERTGTALRALERAVGKNSSPTSM